MKIYRYVGIDYRHPLGPLNLYSGCTVCKYMHVGILKYILLNISELKPNLNLIISKSVALDDFIFFLFFKRIVFSHVPFYARNKYTFIVNSCDH